MSAAGCEPGAPLLELHGISKRHGGVIANDSIAFTVGQGERVALIGPNGSGKTTLLDAIAGQSPPDSGEVRFAGRSLSGLSVGARARLGLLRTFQDAGVYDRMTGFENLQSCRPHAGEPLRALWRRPDRSRAERALHWLHFVGLGEQGDCLAGELSYGQRKLLEFAMALMQEPAMLLLDEPTAGVSPARVPQLIDCLRRVNEELGITLLFVEHDLQVVSALAQRVHCLTGGRLLASGSVQEIRADQRVIDAYLGVA